MGATFRIPLRELTYPELLDHLDAVEEEVKQRRRVYDDQVEWFGGPDGQSGWRSGSQVHDPHGAELLRREVRDWPEETLRDELMRVTGSRGESTASKADPFYRTLAAEWLRRVAECADGLELEPEHLGQLSESRLPDALDIEYEHFGACPRCLQAGGVWNVGRTNWMACRDCRTRWLFGSGFGPYTEGQEREEAIRFLESCEEVESRIFGLIEVDGEAVRRAIEERRDTSGLPF